MKKRGGKPYGGTKVEVAVTQYRDITGLFVKYGVERWQFDTDKRAHVADARFQLPEGDWVRVRLRAPVDPGMTPKQVDQAERTIWRAMYYWLKSQFEAVEYGVFKSQEAFFAWLEFYTPEGPVTMSEAILPQLRQVTEKLALMPPEDGDVVDGEMRELGDDGQQP